MNTEITLYDYWRILNRRKWTALIVLCAVLVSTLVYSLLQLPVYKSQAIIKLQTQAAAYGLGVLGPGDLDPRNAVATEIRVLTSAEIAERAGKKLGLFGVGAPFVEAEAIDRLLAAYTVERMQDSNLIGISAADKDPLAACDIINAVIDVYKDYDLEQKSRQSRKNLEDIASKRIEVEENLRSLERSRQDFMEKNPGTGRGAVLANQLADLESRKKTFLEKYTPDHPGAIELDNKIQALQSELDGIPARELQLARISRELRLQEELYIALNKQYEEAKLGLSSIVSAVSVVKQARAGAEPVSPNRPLNMLVGFILGIFLSTLVVFLLESLDVSISTIEEIESYLNLPVLGLICNVPVEKRLRAWLARTIKKEHHADIAALRNALIAGRKHATSMIESFHSLRLNIMSQFKNKGSVSLVFSSAGAAEGKTLTAVNFALAAAHAGLKTLLVDADIRRPVVYRVFGLDKQPGLSDVLVDRIDWRAALCDSTDFAVGGGSFKMVRNFSGIERLSILNSGASHGNTADFMDSFDWSRLLSEFKKEFDLIIFDTPPALLFIDSIVMAKRVDGVVMVYRAGRTARTALKRATEQLKGAGARVLGVALNGVRASEMGPQYGYYYHDYKRYASRGK